RTDWRRESPLWKLPQFSRQAPSCERAQERLSLRALLLPRRRNSERELDDLPIEQRTADLETMRHAHAVDFYQRIVRQVDLEVCVLGALYGVLRAASPIRCCHGIVDRTFRDI